MALFLGTAFACSSFDAQAAIKATTVGKPSIEKITFHKNAPNAMVWFTWAKVANAQKYEVQYSVSSATTKKSGSFIATRRVLRVDGIKIKSNTSGTLTVKVRAVNGSKKSAWMVRTIKYGKANNASYTKK